MEIRKPYYFDGFSCLAEACPDSCCQQWDVQIDEKSAALYASLPGPLGDRLRQVMYREDGETYFANENRRCPMWRTDGLCQIQAELGHKALCKTCREFPRLTHDYGDFAELGLELSCPEAARRILQSEARAPVIIQVPGGEIPEYDREAMAILLRTRIRALEILQNPAFHPREALAHLLYYGYQAQEELDGVPESDYIPVEFPELPAGNPAEFLNFFRKLEILTPQWQERLLHPREGKHWSGEYRSLARYFVERYWLQAVSDYDLVSRVKFAVISCLTIFLLGGELLETAQTYSKEIENSAENVDAILDGAYCCPAFTDVNLLSLLLP